jgi:hypothetical protein
MLSLEDSPGIETVSNAFELLGDTLNIWDDARALVCCICRGTVASRWLYYGVNKLLCVFIKHQMMSYVLNFIVEIFLILTYDLSSADQIMNESPFYMMWVIPLIKTQALEIIVERVQPCSDNDEFKIILRTCLVIACTVIISSATGRILM